MAQDKAFGDVDFALSLRKKQPFALVINFWPGPRIPAAVYVNYCIHSLSDQGMMRGRHQLRLEIRTLGTCDQTLRKNTTEWHLSDNWLEVRPESVLPGTEPYNSVCTQSDHLPDHRLQLWKGPSSHLDSIPRKTDQISRERNVAASGYKN